MRRFLLLSSLVFLGACGGGGDADPDQPSETGLEAASRMMQVYRSFGNKQCEPPTTTLAELQAQLLGAGVQASDAYCGTTGHVYAAACGVDDGQLGIFLIAPDQLDAARRAGFGLLKDDFPEASRTECRR